MLLDTNAYSELILDKQALALLLELIPSCVIVYGAEIIRAELRGVPRRELLEQRNKRILLLNLYDLVTQKDKRTYLTTPSIEALALQYFDEYKRLRGKLSFEELRKDFVIVATASIHGIDVIVSEDAKTMFSKEAVRAYQLVNVKTQLRTPFFHSLAAFRAFLQSQSAKGEDDD